MTSIHKLGRRQFITAAAALGGAAVLTGCGDNATAAKTGSSGSPKSGGTLNVGMISFGAAETMNLSTIQTDTDFIRVGQIYQGLFQSQGPNFDAIPVLAESMELSDGARQHTITLRRDVEWHDGKPFTADDVVWTVGMWKHNPTFGGQADVIDYSGVRKRDLYTVEIPTTVGIVDLPGIVASNFASYIIQDGQLYSSKKSIGTGPFKFESFTPGSQSVFSANRNYWGGKPYLDSLVVNTTFQTDTTRFNALVAGAIDVMPNFPFALVKQAKQTSSLYVLSANSAEYIAPVLRVDKPPFNDPRVVTAMKLLVDRQAMLEYVFDGYGSIGNDVGMAGVPDFASSLHRDRDVDQAKSLLKAAGQENLTVTLNTAALVDGMNQMATIYAQQAAEAGVKVQIQQLSPSVYYDFSGSNAYLTRTLGMSQWLPFSLTAYYLQGLWTGAAYNESHWGNATTNKQLFDVIAEQDPVQAQDKWYAIQLQQFDAGGYIIPVNNAFIDGYASDVHGVTTTANGPCNNYDFTKAWKAT